ncbi:MAG: ATP-dependent helicase, partial [Variovorax sp.]
FNDRRPAGGGAPAPRGFGGGNREEGNFGRKPGWGDNAAPRGGRNEGFGGGAPRGNTGGKVFVPRDAKPRAFKPAR